MLGARRHLFATNDSRGAAAEDVVENADVGVAVIDKFLHELSSA
jgi:hypothetical protein